MFAGKARSLPKSGAPKKYFTRVGSGLTHKHKTSYERLARDKHSSLLAHSQVTKKKSVVDMYP